MIKIVPGKRNREMLILINALQKATPRGIRQGFFALGRDNVKDARQAIIRGKKSGRLYNIPGRKRRHRASAPGEAPANLTGKLQKSVGFQIQGAEEMEFGYRDAVDYGAFLELGTTKMAKRPNLEPTVFKNVVKGRRHFEREIKKAHKT